MPIAVMSLLKHHPQIDADLEQAERHALEVPFLEAVLCLEQLPPLPHKIRAPVLQLRELDGLLFRPAQLQAPDPSAVDHILQVPLDMFLEEGLLSSEALAELRWSCARAAA